jgi:hypothetical protein
VVKAIINTGALLIEVVGLAITIMPVTNDVYVEVLVAGPLCRDAKVPKTRKSANSVSASIRSRGIVSEITSGAPVLTESDNWNGA